MTQEEQLVEMKKRMVDMLVDIDEFCKKNGLVYYLAYGTLLGAVRHHGFIPWDDDVDIEMPRKDYEKFIKTYHSKYYKLIDCYSNDKYYLPWAKVYDSHSILKEETRSSIPIGIYIDVFPIDVIPDDIKIQKKLINKQHSYTIKNNLKSIKLSKERKWYKNVTLLIGRLLTCGVNINKLSRKEDSLYKTYDATNGHKCVCLPWFIRLDRAINVDSYGKPIKLSFEEHLFNCPQNYDDVLKHCYGDYMKLPPIEEQVTHHKYTLTFLK